MSDRIKDAVISEAKSASAVSQDVLKSGAYLYPFKVSWHPTNERYHDYI